jgi:hypothetical protein
LSLRDDPAEVAKAYGVSKSWLYELLARHRAEGDGAFEPRSRRPKTLPNATPLATVGLGVRRVCMLNPVRVLPDTDRLLPLAQQRRQRLVQTIQKAP